MSSAAWPSTLFTAGPHWHWLIVCYFFVGGLAGGCFVLAALIDLFGSSEDRALARLGYYVAFPAVVVCGLLLILDLGRPLRFWHMLIESNVGRPMFKTYSPMSLGSWALLTFGAFALAAFLAALADADRLRAEWPERLRPPGALGAVVVAVGGLLGFFVAGYTGVLLTVTNRPIWADTPLLGLNFVLSAASTSGALLVLLAGRRRRATHGLQALEGFDSWTLVLELVALVALVASLGSMVHAWLNAWGVLLVLGVVVVGILVPLALRLIARSIGEPSAAVAAVLILVGGFILRIVVILSSEGIGRPT